MKSQRVTHPYDMICRDVSKTLIHCMPNKVGIFNPNTSWSLLGQQWLVRSFSTAIFCYHYYTL